MTEQTIEQRVSEIESLTDIAGAIAQRDAEQQVQRQREADNVVRVKRLKELKAELGAHNANYLEDIRQAQVALRASAAAIGRVLEHAKAIAKVSHQISDKPAPIVFGITDVTRRMGMSVAAIMGSIPGYEYRLGVQEWQRGHHKSSDDLVARESALLNRHVQPLTE